MEIPGLRSTLEVFRSHRRAAAGVAIASLIAGTLRVAKGLRASGNPPNSNKYRWRELTVGDLGGDDASNRTHLHIVPDQEPTVDSHAEPPTDTIAS